MSMTFKCNHDQHEPEPYQQELLLAIVMEVSLLQRSEKTVYHGHIQYLI